MTAVQQRAAASYLGETYKVLQRKAARGLGRSRSTLRYRPADRSRQAPLVKAIQRLARQHPRWGYRFSHALLVRQGWQVNLQCVHRLWQELQLPRPLRRRKAKKLGFKPGTSANRCVNRPARFQDDVWTYDFVADRTVSGSPLTWLTRVDEYTRECLALYVAAAGSGAEVRRMLTRVIGRRRAPQSLRSDNGSAFIGAALRQWLPQQGTEPLPVASGSPWEHGYAESLNSRFGDEFLEAEQFASVLDAKEKGAWFRRAYNTIGPHRSLDYQTPQEFSDQCDQRRKKGKKKDKRRI